MSLRQGFPPGWPVKSGWTEELSECIRAPQFEALIRRVDAERKKHEVFPAESDTFAAFRLTSPEKLKVVLLGQDPYHGPGQAHGFAFLCRVGRRFRRH